MEICLIHSIKGGCGKSTVALTLASQLAAARDGKSNKVCLLDMDFKSTGLENLIVNKPNTNGEMVSKAADRPFVKNGDLHIWRGKNDFFYWNECFTDASKAFSHNALTQLRWGTNGQQFDLDILFSNPKQAAKNLFVKSYASIDGANVSVGLFQYTFRNILEWLLNEKYDYVIMDLPPSFDDYTSTIYSTLLDVREGFVKKRGSVNAYLLLISTFDITHLTSTAEYMRKLLKQDSARRIEFKHIVFILNDITNMANEKSVPIEMIIEAAKGICEKIIHGDVVLSKSAYDYCLFQFSEVIRDMSLISAGATVPENIINLCYEKGSVGYNPITPNATDEILKYI